MEFENRINKEMTEGVFRALIDDAGYRVIEGPSWDAHFYAGPVVLCR